MHIQRISEKDVPSPKTKILMEERLSARFISPADVFGCLWEVNMVVVASVVPWGVFSSGRRKDAESQKRLQVSSTRRCNLSKVPCSTAPNLFQEVKIPKASCRSIPPEFSPFFFQRDSRFYNTVKSKCCPWSSNVTEAQKRMSDDDPFMTKYLQSCWSA